MARLLFGLGIRHVGERAASLLAAHYGSFEALSAAGVEELAEIRDIGPVIAESVSQFCGHEENRRTLARLAEAGVRLEQEPVAAAATRRCADPGGQGFRPHRHPAESQTQ